MTTADKLFALIDESGTASVNSLATETHIPRSTLNRRLATDEGWLVTELIALAKALNVRPIDLLPDTFTQEV